VRDFVGGLTKAEKGKLEKKQTSGSVELSRKPLREPENRKTCAVLLDQNIENQRKDKINKSSRDNWNGRRGRRRRQIWSQFFRAGNFRGPRFIFKICSAHPIQWFGPGKEVGLPGAKEALHAAAIMQDWLDARGIQALLYPAFLPDLASANFFLIPKQRNFLSDRTLTHKTIKTTMDGVDRPDATEEYAVAFMKVIEQFHKFIEIKDNCVKKGRKYTFW